MLVSCGECSRHCNAKGRRMRSVSFLINGHASYGVLRDGRVLEASREFRARHPDLRSVLAADELDALDANVDAMADTELRFLPPIRSSMTTRASSQSSSAGRPGTWVRTMRWTTLRDSCLSSTARFATGSVTRCSSRRARISRQAVRPDPRSFPGMKWVSPERSNSSPASTVR